MRLGATQGASPRPPKPDLHRPTDAGDPYQAIITDQLPSAAGFFEVSDRGGQRAATIISLIATAKMNDVDPQAWLADVLARIAEHPASRLDELLPWEWQKPQPSRSAA